jgi:hypothetical protein
VKRRSEELWQSVDDPALDRGLVEELRKPVDVDAVFDDTLATLVAKLLEG